MESRASNMLRGSVGKKKTKNGNGIGIGIGNGTRKAESGGGAGKIPILCMSLIRPLQGTINFLAVDFNNRHKKENKDDYDDDIDISVSEVGELEPLDPNLGVGYTSLGSELYVVGGELVRKTGKFPKDVHVGRFQRKQGGAITCSWRHYPKLNGPKPSPMVATVKGKIYALASGCGRFSERISTPFEVLDPSPGKKIGGRRAGYPAPWMKKGGRRIGWQPLPPPPFHPLYDTPGLHIAAHTVIGHTIYVLVRKNGGDAVLYSYDTILGIWDKHNGGDDDDHGTISPPHHNKTPDDPVACRIAKNLSLLYWFGRADVVDDRLYQWTWGTNAFAVDLLLTEEEGMIARGEKNKCADCLRNKCADCLREGGERDDDFYGDEDLDDFDDLVKLPIHGLEAVTDLIPRRMNNKGFLAHLRDNLFCFVSLFYELRNSSCQYKILVVAFRIYRRKEEEEEGNTNLSGSSSVIRGRCLHAKVSKMLLLPLDSEVGELDDWCTIKI